MVCPVCRRERLLALFIMDLDMSPSWARARCFMLRVGWGMATCPYYPVVYVSTMSGLRPTRSTRSLLELSAPAFFRTRPTAPRPVLPSLLTYVDAVPRSSSMQDMMDIFLLHCHMWTSTGGGGASLAV